MRFSRSAKATALLLLVSLQYTFAAVDVAICSTALCYPKVTGGKVQKAMKKCPDGFTLEKDGSGKAMCMKRVAKACTKQTKTTCSAQIGGMCPSGTIAKKDCGNVTNLEVSFNKTGRHLLEGGAVVKEINVVGHHMGIPNIILPKPAVSINMAKPTKPAAGGNNIKFNGGSHGFPQIILPEPRVSINVPPMPKVGPEIKFEGHPAGHVMPHIIPVLPEPLVTIEMPKNGFGKAMAAPQIKTDFSSKKVTLDLSQLGPKHTVDVNLPAMPDILHQVTKPAEIEVNLPDNMPKVIDLSGLGPKKVYDITLPQVKIPKQGSITFVGSGDAGSAKEPKFLDLTHLGPKHKTGINVKLPEVETQGASLNVIIDDDKSIKDGAVIVVPGHKERHHTIINVPGADGKEWPEKQSKLVVDVNLNKDSFVHQAIAKLDALKAAKNGTSVEKVSIKMPDVDLTGHLPAGKDIVVQMKPLLKFDDSAFTMTKPNSTNIEQRINIDLAKNITLPRLMKDTTIVVKPLEVGAVAKHLLPKHVLDAWNAENAGNSTGNSSVVTTTTTTINMPNHTLPQIPVPKDKIDAAVSIPLGFSHNGSQPGVINIAYKEEWVGGKPVLPNPAAGVIKKVEHIVDAISSVHCPTLCCQDVTVEVCDEKAVEVQSVEPSMACEEGWTMDAATGTCSNGDAKVGACPDGMGKCHIDGKGVCVPSVEGKVGADLCSVFKAVCHKGTILAKSCSA